MAKLHALEIRIQEEENMRNKELESIKKYIFQNFRQKSGITGENIGMFPSIGNSMTSPKTMINQRNPLSPKHNISKSMAFDNQKDMQTFENKIKFLEMKQKLNEKMKKETRP
jgi:hypothetical protein